MTAAQLTTRDGCTLAAELARPHPGTDLTGAVVVCHPHPQYGGNRFDRVVTALFDELPTAGFAVLRFDFRREFGGGVDERLDVVAALDHLDTVAELAGAPRYLAGYSFGAVVALTTDDARVAAVAAVAPPLAVMAVADPGVPTLVLTPRHDQFSSPETTAPVVSAWRESDFDVVESADHFLGGHAKAVAARVVSWLTARG